VSIDRAKAALQIFEAALEVAPAARASWVQDACRDDAELAVEVSTLLAAHDEVDDFLDSGPETTKIFFAAASLPSLELVVGQQLGDFIVEQQIGAGGMGVVYRARQISLNRLVALKVLPPHLRYSENAQTRFQREVEAAARLNHPNIVAVYTTGEDDGATYYAMELIDGPALSELIEELKHRPLAELRECAARVSVSNQSQASTRSKAGDTTPPPGDLIVKAPDWELLSRGRNYFDAVANLIADVAEGLQYAHAMKVVHRDIKPSNLLLSKDGEIHISDFGLARVAQEPGLTRTGEVIGTPYYMAPEQIYPAMGVVDERTDIYSLGATLYELLTLRPPFGGEQREQVIAQITHDEPVAPKTVNHHVPRDLDTICLKALEKYPPARYQTAGEMAEDLRRFLARVPISARALTPLSRGLRWVQRHRTWATALATICCLAMMALFFAYRTYRSEVRWSDAQFAQLFETAQLAALEGNLERASTAIDDAEKLGASGAELLLLRGQLDLQAGVFQDACDKLEQAVEQMPNSVAAHALLANAYESNEEHEKSARIAKVLPTLEAVTLQDYLLLGQAQFYSDFALGLSTLDQAVQLDKTSVQARLTRGSILAERAMDTGDIETADRALDDLRIAGELLDPNCYLLGNQLQAHLIAATAEELAGNEKRRQQHLAESRQIAQKLTRFPEQYRSHRWRGLYFEYICEDRQALEAWLAMQEWQIAYLVLTYFRLGNVDEGIAVCDERLARIENARSTQFFRSLLLSSQVSQPNEVVAGFAPQGPETLDGLNLHRFNYTIQCLAGNLPRAQELSREFRATPQARSPKGPWRHHLLAFTCGDIDAEEFLKRSAESRIDLCQAHFFVAMSHLARGERSKARQHFQTGSQLKIVGSLEEAISRSLLVQLERDPAWPRWIPEHTIDD